MLLCFQSYTPDSMSQRLMFGASVLLLQAVLVLGAGAQEPLDCPEDLGQGPREVTPADGAGGVTRDAVVQVGYTVDFFGLARGPLNELLEVFEVDSESPVAGEYQVVGGETLFFIPDEPLLSDTAYRGVARGVENDLEFSFRTGATLDQIPPEMRGVAWATSVPVDTACESPEGGYRVEVQFPPALDDGPAGSVEYWLYLTRGAGQGAPVVRARARGYRAQLITMAFVLTPEEAAEPICVDVIAVDGVGRISNGQATACLDPYDRSFFNGLCSAINVASDGPQAPAIWLVVMGLVLAGRRRRPRIDDVRTTETPSGQN